MILTQIHGPLEMNNLEEIPALVKLLEEKGGVMPKVFSKEADQMLRWTSKDKRHTYDSDEVSDPRESAQAERKPSQ
jgi:hypothetical protein